VVFDVADRAIDGARQRMLGGECNLADAGDLFRQFTACLPGNGLYLGDACRLTRRQQRVTRGMATPRRSWSGAICA